MSVPRGDSFRQKFGTNPIRLWFAGHPSARAWPGQRRHEGLRLKWRLSPPGFYTSPLGLKRAHYASNPKAADHDPGRLIPDVFVAFAEIA
jgi:hypothetical protein